MYRTLCKTTGFALVLALVLVPAGIAQQQRQHEQHHPGGTLTPQGQPAAIDAQADDEEDEPGPMMQQMQGMMQNMQDMMQQMRGMMGEGMMGPGGMLQRHLQRLAQQLGLTDDQRAQARYIMRNHAKEIIRLRADIATLQLDVRPLLDTDPVDLPKVKQLLQTIATKEADLRLSHIAAMQEVRKLLTPEQQKKFHAMQDAMMGDGGMMGQGGMMRGGMMGHGPKAQ